MAPPYEPENMSYTTQLMWDGIKSFLIFCVSNCQLAMIANTPPINAHKDQYEVNVAIVESPRRRINNHITIGLPTQFVFVLNENKARRIAATPANAAPVYAPRRVKCEIQKIKLKSCTSRIAFLPVK